MTLKNLGKKLEKLRKELGQTVIVRLGLPAEGGFDILGIECLGNQQEQEQMDAAMRPKPEPKKTKPTYIG